MKKLTITLAVLAVVFLGLAFLSASYSVSRTISAIDAIGQVSFDEASREKIDLAESFYGALDPNLHLEDRISNLSALADAKSEYVRLAIKTALVKEQRKTAEGYTDEDILEAVDQAQEALETYYPSEDYSALENYEDLLALEAQYAGSGSSASAAAPAPAASGESETIELC